MRENESYGGLGNYALGNKNELGVVPEWTAGLQTKSYIGQKYNRLSVG